MNLNYIHIYIQEFNLRTHVMWVYFQSSPMLTVWLPLAVLKASTGYLSLFYLFNLNNNAFRISANKADLFAAHLRLS